jgi:hypothetical protein
MCCGEATARIRVLEKSIDSIWREGNAEEIIPKKTRVKASSLKQDLLKQVANLEINYAKACTTIPAVEDILAVDWKTRMSAIPDADAPQNAHPGN